jgi:alpha-beta hydrolase superfamily lysophospholipase
VLSVVTPRLGVYSVDPELVSRDPAEVLAYREDPLVHHGKLPARTVAELTAAIERFETDVPKLELPLLVMHGTADELTPPDGSRMVERLAGSADKTLILYDGLYHELFNELREDRERAFADLTGWLEPRL